MKKMIILVLLALLSCGYEPGEDSRNDNGKINPVGTKIFTINDESESVTKEEESYLLSICNALAIKNLNGMEKNVLFKNYDCDGKVTEQTYSLKYDVDKFYIFENGRIFRDRPYTFSSAVTANTSGIFSLCQNLKAARKIKRFEYMGADATIAQAVALRKNSRSCYLGSEPRTNTEDEYCLQIVTGVRNGNESKDYKVQGALNYVIIPSGVTKGRPGQVKYQFQTIGDCESDGDVTINSERLVI